MASRASGPSPKTSPKPFGPEKPSSTTSIQPKHMPAAKYFPAKAHFVEPPPPASAQQAQFAPNFEPSTRPCPPVPGKLQSENFK
eukprot:12183236-Alexandrium_andersonii.AAC.1